MSFMYEIACESEPPFPLSSTTAVIAISFRHFGPASIEIGVSGEPGALNLGFRVIRQRDAAVVFEDRVKSPGREIGYDEPVALDVVVPRHCVELGETYTLSIDLVYENMYWFEEHNASAASVAAYFVDEQAEKPDAIGEMQAFSIEGYLAKAYARIAELEISERGLHAEKDYYRARFEALSRRVETQYETLALLPPPASRLGSALEAVDIVTRRDDWLNQLVKSGLEGAIFGLYPHDGKPGHKQILIYGSGGYGDMVYLTPIVRELHEMFFPCHIVVLHENKNVADVFANNPYVMCAISLSGENWRRFVEAAHCFDVFDMLVDVRYAVTYVFPPLSRVPLAFRLRAQYASAEYQKYIRFAAWPKLNNLLANLVMSRGMRKLDLIGQTSLLPIDGEAELDLFVAEADMLESAWDPGRPYITVHHGADRNMASAERALQTKNCDLDFWTELTTLAKAAGFTVVQLGQKGEALIANVDRDLRGKTTLAQTAAVIKMADAHVDTEGGLVHVARAVQNRSVVMFGPTPVGFFGYPQNVNFGPKVCGNCWWSTEDWSKACPRDLREPECMASHVPAEILAAAREVAAGELNAFRVVACEPQRFAAAFLEDADLKARLQALDAAAGIVVGPHCPLDAALALLTSLKTAATVFVDFARFGHAVAQSSGDLRLRAFSIGNFPVRDRSLSALVALDLDIRNVRGASFCADLARTVSPDGRLVIRAANAGEPMSAATWLEHFENACRRIPGGRLSRLFAPGAQTVAGETAVLYLTLAAAPKSKPAVALPLEFVEEASVVAV